MSRAARVVTLALAIVAAQACRETRPLPQARPVTQDSSDVTLVASDASPAAGDTVRVSARLRARSDSSTGVASYTARLRYDTTALRFLGDTVVGDGALRVVNPMAGQLRLAGAAANGFTTGTLFIARFEVVRAGGLASLDLSFDELHDASAREVRASTRVSSRIAPESP